MATFGTIETRKGRIKYQLDQWVKGQYLHNYVDDECCPDFACCNETMRTPEEMRKTYKAAWEQGKDEITDAMLMSFLGEAIGKHNPDAKVHITNGNHDHLNN